MSSNNKSIKYLFISLLFIVVSFGSGIFVGIKKDQINLPFWDRIKVTNKESNEVEVDFSQFWEVWQEVEKRYLYQKDVSPQQMVDGAIKGMVSSLGDPYSVYFNSNEFTELKKSMASQYEGIGVEMGFKNNSIIVVTPFEGSPAKTAGVRAGDYILKIGEEDTAGMNLTEAANKIRGEKGTSIKLTLLHSEETESYEVEIERSVITYDTVVLEFRNDIAYLRVLHFADSTNQEWDEAVKKIQAQNPKGIVLDLRNNPGGYVNSAVYLASDFVGKEVVVKQKYADGTVKDLKPDQSKNRLSAYETVIILNEGSASASEILAGALLDYDKALIVGQKSFGKGIVQDQIPLEEGAGLHVTTSEWLTPDGNSIHKQGITPDIIVEMTEEQIKEGLDPQFDKAVEILNQ